MNLASRLNAASRRRAAYVAVTVVIAVAAGCTPSVTTGRELQQFQMADAPGAQLALNGYSIAKAPTGSYRTVPGDLLALRMPSVMQSVAEAQPASPDTYQPQMRRIRKDGTITLPVVGEVEVAGMTLGEVEEAIEQAYWPQHVINRPSVVAQISAYDTVAVTVTGAGVVKPGTYYLRSDQRCLSGALVAAGGLSGFGADSVAVYPPEPAEDAQPAVVPVRSGSVPVADVALAGGERLEVRPRGAESVTITGLIRSPGVYPYDWRSPPNLIEALTMAGGVREVDDPRFVSIYRRDASDKMISARFRLNRNSGINGLSLMHDSALGEGAFAAVKAGDVLVVERSDRSRTRGFLLRTVSLSAGVSASADTGVTHYTDYGDSGSDRGGTTVNQSSTTINYPAAGSQ